MVQGYNKMYNVAHSDVVQESYYIKQADSSPKSLISLQLLLGLLSSRA